MHPKAPVVSSHSQCAAVLRSLLGATNRHALTQLTLNSLRADGIERLPILRRGDMQRHGTTE